MAIATAARVGLRSHLAREIEKEHGKALRDVLADLYQEYGDWSVVARKVGTSRQHLYIWFNQIQAATGEDLRLLDPPVRPRRVPFDRQGPRIRQVETKYGKPLRDVLIEMYNETHSWRVVARRLGAHCQTVYWWVEVLGIKVDHVARTIEVADENEEPAPATEV